MESGVSLGYSLRVSMNQLRTRLPTVLLLSGLLAATIVLLEPAKSAVGNWNDIVIGFSELFAKLAMPFGVAFVAIAAPALLFTVVAPRRSIPVLVALYAMFWAQGSLFVSNYGIFDGSPIDWSEHTGKGVLEIAAWAAALGLALAKPHWIRPFALRITAIVFVLQLAALADQIRQSPPLVESLGSERSMVRKIGSSQISRATDFSLIQSMNLYSRDLNVIVLVLDTVQSDYFAEAMRDPERRAAMPPGFTFYRNAVSLYDRTQYSLQSMLTSKAVPDKVDYAQWTRENAAHSLPVKLVEEGFDTVLTTFAPPHYNDFGRWGYNRVLSANLVELGSASAAWRQDVSNMFALGLFRLAPHFLKPRIYDDGQWRIRRLYPPEEAIWQSEKDPYKTPADLAAFDELMASASAAATAPQFRFQHFYGVHKPWTVDDVCGEVDRSLTLRGRAIEATQCLLSRVFEFLHKLDEIGVYDQSLIFVISDHGEKMVPLDLLMASPGLPGGEKPRVVSSSEEAPIDRYWRGVPIFLAKPLYDRQPLRVSDHPVSLCDVPKSVLDTLRIENDFGCESIFSEQSSRRAPRMHYRYPGQAEQRALGISPRDGLEFDKYAVEGHSWLPESWVPVAADTEPSR